MSEPAGSAAPYSGKSEGAALFLHVWAVKKTQLKGEWHVLCWGAALIPSLLWYFFHRRQELLAEERKAEEAKEASEGKTNE